MIFSLFHLCMYHVNGWTLCKGLPKGLPCGSKEGGSCVNARIVTTGAQNHPHCGCGINSSQNLREARGSFNKGMSTEATIQAAEAWRKGSRKVESCHQTNMRINSRAHVFATEALILHICLLNMSRSAPRMCRSSILGCGTRKMQ